MEDIRPGEGQRRGLTREQRSGQGWKPGVRDERAEGPLVHAQSRSGQARPAVVDAGEVKCRLQRSVFTGSTMRAEHQSLKVAAAVLAHAPTN